MRILVNALSVDNISGRVVLLGHLKQIAGWTQSRHEFVVLHHTDNRDMVSDLGPHVTWLEVSRRCRKWWYRAWWERAHLPRLCQRRGIDCCFNPAGITYGNLSSQQVSFAQNPWCLVPGLAHGPGERLKAAIQRRAYATAMRQARYMIFNSKFMESAYEANADCQARATKVIYQAIPESTFQQATQADCDPANRERSVLCVSVMGSHKGIETLVLAVAELAQRPNPARLKLVGGWPDANYRLKVEQLIKTHRITDRVEIAGHVSRDELEECYAKSRVFALMSRCESFGIPAVEAQAFGTPVISSNVCAIPEVCGDGGEFHDPDDVSGVAGAIANLMDDDEAWRGRSQKARDNAERFHWHICSKPFLEVFNDIEESVSPK